MINKTYTLCFALLLAWLFPAQLLAGDVILKYMDSTGTLHPITSMADLDALVPAGTAGSANIRSCFQKYFANEQSAKDTASIMTGDLTLVIRAKDTGNDKGSFARTAAGFIQIQTEEAGRFSSVLLHELGHIKMYNKCGEMPTKDMTKRQKYGNDEDHYLNEVLNEKTALSEGYADYLGITGGDDEVPCPGAGSLEKLSYEIGGKYIDRPWKTTLAEDSMWKTEGINAAIFKNLVALVQNGGAKVEEFLCGTDKTLKGLIKAWADKYPADRERLAQIVDANTNYLMSDEDLLALTKASDYVGKKRDEQKQKYKGKGPCDYLDDLLKDVPATSTPTPPLLPPPLSGSGGGVGSGNSGSDSSSRTPPKLKNFR